METYPVAKDRLRCRGGHDVLGIFLLSADREFCLNDLTQICTSLAIHGVLLVQNTNKESAVKSTF